MNLDAFNAAWMALRGEDEKADFLDGFAHGMNLAPFVEGTRADELGFSLGRQARLKTEQYREGQSKNGKLGGRPRKETAALPPLKPRLTDVEAEPKVTVYGLPAGEDCRAGQGSLSQGKLSVGPEHVPPPVNQDRNTFPPEPTPGLAFPSPDSSEEDWPNDGFPLAQVQTVNGARR